MHCTNRTGDLAVCIAWPCKPDENRSHITQLTPCTQAGMQDRPDGQLQSSTTVLTLPMCKAGPYNQGIAVRCRSRTEGRRRWCWTWTRRWFTAPSSPSPTRTTSSPWRSRARSWTSTSSSAPGSTTSWPPSPGSLRLWSSPPASPNTQVGRLRSDLRNHGLRSGCGHGIRGPGRGQGCYGHQLQMCHCSGHMCAACCSLLGYHLKGCPCLLAGLQSRCCLAALLRTCGTGVPR